jgi:hypothetical protein
MQQIISAKTLNNQTNPNQHQSLKPPIILNTKKPQEKEIVKAQILIHSSVSPTEPSASSSETPPSPNSNTTHLNEKINLESKINFLKSLINNENNSNEFNMDHDEQKFKYFSNELSDDSSMNSCVSSSNSTKEKIAEENESNKKTVNKNKQHNRISLVSESANYNVNVRDSNVTSHVEYDESQEYFMNNQQSS